jgi:apolipoprotein N-acyltransferase
LQLATLSQHHKTFRCVLFFANALIATIGVIWLVCRYQAALGWAMEKLPGSPKGSRLHYTVVLGALALAILIIWISKRFAIGALNMGTSFLIVL